MPVIQVWKQTRKPAREDALLATVRRSVVSVVITSNVIVESFHRWRSCAYRSKAVLFTTSYLILRLSKNYMNVTLNLYYCV